MGVEFWVSASLAFALFILILIANLGVKHFEKEYNKSKEYMSYDDKSGQLTIMKRGEINRGRLHIEPMRNYQTKYNPEKYVYTGATVGGVTMGGIHKKDAYYSIASMNKTGRYSIEYLDWGTGSLVKKLVGGSIQLTDELFEEAKKSIVMSLYLDNDKKTIELMNKIELSELAKAALKNQQKLGLYGTMNIINTETANAWPTKEKCAFIINWICGVG